MVALPDDTELCPITIVVAIRKKKGNKLENRLTHNVELGEGIVLVLSNHEPRSGGHTTDQLAIISGFERISQRIDDGGQVTVRGDVYCAQRYIKVTVT